jgi:hypothetical protein
MFPFNDFPLITDPLLRAGMQKMNDRDYVGALADFDQLIETNPTWFAYSFRSMARESLGDEGGAKEDREMFFKLSVEYSAQVNRGFRRLRSWDLLGGSQDIYSGLFHIWTGK